MRNSGQGGPPKLTRPVAESTGQSAPSFPEGQVVTDGAGALAKLGSTPILSGLLSGLLGGLSGVVFFGVADGLGFSNGNLRRGVLVLAVSICSAVVLSAWPDLTASRFEAAFRSVLRATPLAMVGGGIGLALATPPFGWLDGYDSTGGSAVPALMVAFALVAGSLGVAIGLPVATRKAALGCIGGLAGGGLGGLVLALVGGGGQASLGQLALAVPVATMALGATMGATERLARECWVEVVDGPLAGRQIILYGDRIVLGNGGRAVTLGDPSMPDQHLEVLARGGVVHVRGLDAAALTELNFSPLAGQAQVSSDDVISLENSHIRIKHS